MRKAITIFYLVALLMIISCETERIIFKGPYFVRFTESSRTEKESFSKVIAIEVHNAGPALEEGVTVSYKISGDAREGVDFTILGENGKVTIPPGEYVGNIQLQLINNANNILRSQDIIFTIQSVGTSQLQVGQGESAIGKTFTFTINDDCILGGSYIGKRGSTSMENITITSTDCETYTLSNWNIGVFNTVTEMDLKFVDNGDNSLTIPEQEEENISEDLATIKGTGIVDPTTRVIILTIILVDFEGQPEVKITLDPD